MTVEYRYKPDKHKFKENITTIDELHRTRLSKFKQNKIDIPKKMTELRNLKEELANLQENKKNIPINHDIEYLKHLNKTKKRISLLEEDINNISNNNDELEYYSKIGDVIYDYYALTNGGLYDKFNEECITSNNIKSITNSSSKIQISNELSTLTTANRKRKIKKPIKRRNKKNIIKPQKNIMSYLLNNHTKNEEQDNSYCKATLQNEYLIMIDKDYACLKSKLNPIRKCEKCKTDKVVIFSESISTCLICGESENISTDIDIPSYGDVFNEKPKYPYRRIGHCIEKLNQFLCKGNINIPNEIFIILEMEINKHGLTKKNITIKFLERMLKKHKKSNYYEYIMYIYNKLTNTPPKVLTQSEYDLILKMFMVANDVYEKKYKPSNRNNFLKYTFVLHKIFMTIGKPDYASYFKILKSETKLKEQEKIWKKICLDLGWKYHAGSCINSFT
jgi:hypothetical protein